MQPTEQPLVDERLIGEWQSDAERTIAGIRESQSVDEAREAGLRSLFGRMRVTFSPTTITTVLDESTAVLQYRVLGRDRHSVVIQELETEPSPLECLELSTFTIIQFAGPDSYWLHTKGGNVQEWFRRVSSS